VTLKHVHTTIVDVEKKKVNFTLEQVMEAKRGE
jgi:hypothetical protein